MTPLRVAHVVCTDAFAGVERSIVLSSRALAARDHEVHVIGGSPAAMPAMLEGAVASWQPARSVLSGVRALRALGALDVVHAHMTAAELAVVLSARWRCSHFVTTRHFAAARGTSARGRVMRPVMSAVPHTELAISPFVAEHLEGPSLLVPHGLEPMPRADRRSKTVVIVQRLEAEKDTATAIRAWAQSSLSGRGWQLDIAGDGAERASLERLAATCGVADSVRFLGHVADTMGLRAHAAIQLASPPHEPFGLSVLEAMACGLPVVAARGGAHPYLLGGDVSSLFGASDAGEAAALLDALATDEAARTALGDRLRARARQQFSLERHAALLEAAYERVSAPAGAGVVSSPEGTFAAPSARPTTSHGNVPVPARQ